MKISIASYAFHGLLSEGKMDVFGYLESLRHRYQLFAADIWNGMLPTLEDSFIRKVREAMDEKELTLVNLCVDDAHIWENDPAERDRLHKNALANLRAAAMLGAKTVRIDMGGRDPGAGGTSADCRTCACNHADQRGNLSLGQTRPGSGCGGSGESFGLLSAAVGLEATADLSLEAQTPRRRTASLTLICESSSSSSPSAQAPRAGPRPR